MNINTVRAITPRRRQRAVAAFVAVATCALIQQSVPWRDAHAQSPAVKPTTTVRYSEIARQILYLPVYVAIARGFFAEQGIAVDLTTTWGSDRTTSALLADDADVVLQGPENAVYMANEPTGEKKIKIFAALTRTDGQFLVSRTKIPMDRFEWKMLRGKTVLGRRTTTTPGLFFEFALRNRGIDPARDINYRTDLAVPAIARLWRTGLGDFAVFFEPQLTRLEREGLAFPVASVGQEAGSVDYTVLMTTEAFLTRNPAVIQGWVNALQKALRWIGKAEPAIAARTVADYFTNDTPEDIARAIARYRRFRIWKAHPTISRKSISDLQSMMIESRVINPENRVAYDRIVTPSFAEQAKKLVN